MPAPERRFFAPSPIRPCRAQAALRVPMKWSSASSQAALIRLARAVSIFGHPMLVMPLAAWLAARNSRGDGSTTWLVLIAIVALGLVVLAYSASRVRGGHWQHVDASAPDERRGLNLFLLGVFVLAAALAAWHSGNSPITVALLLAAAVILLALLTAACCKLSLHVAFACFAIFVPGSFAAAAGIAILAIAVAWSRLVLGRHDRRDILVGALAGMVAGILFQTF